MGRYVMIVQSQAKPGRDDEFNEWYDNQHFSDVCAIPGVLSGRRFEFSLGVFGADGLKYLSIFEIEHDNPAEILAELTRRSVAGEISTSDAIDGGASIMWFYEQREEAASKPTGIPS